MDPKQRLLAYVDYGMGGVFFWILAEGKEELAREHPGLQVLDQPPDWMTTDQVEKLYSSAPVYDLWSDAAAIARLCR